ncbi:MAG: SufD family Fe-S cluster assembly protein [Firmicutes bacterium]|nr:SufD family Fe-S cluster assembly protein [Bacillota bacterium]
MEIPSEISKLLTNDLKNYLVIKDGHVIKKQLEEQFQNIVIEDVKNKIFGNDIPFEKYPFLSNFKDESYQYNIEEINSGVVIEVPRNVVLTDTLHIFYVQEEIDMVNNTLIVVGENAELKYFEYLYNQSSSSINFVSNSIVKENASLSYSGISKLNRQAMVSVIRNSHVYRYGRANYSVAEINDSTTDSKTNIFLEEKYASGTAKTIAITSLEQEAKFHQLIEHNAPDTEGYIENYGVSNNNSVLVFEGCGKINKLMKRSIARQQNRGIVLGAKSRLDANPLLLIDEYDVEASHGAAIGKIDEEQLYYLMSRGLTLKNAERLIISGFLSPVTKLLSTEALMLDFISSVENKTL